jgi:hypothetical protein
VKAAALATAAQRYRTFYKLVRYAEFAKSQAAQRIFYQSNQLKFKGTQTHPNVPICPPHIKHDFGGGFPA